MLQAQAIQHPANEGGVHLHDDTLALGVDELCTLLMVRFTVDSCEHVVVLS